MGGCNRLEQQQHFCSCASSKNRATSTTLWSLHSPLAWQKNCLDRSSEWSHRPLRLRRYYPPLASEFDAMPQRIQGSLAWASTCTRKAGFTSRKPAPGVSAELSAPGPLIQWNRASGMHLVLVSILDTRPHRDQARRNQQHNKAKPHYPLMHGDTCSSPSSKAVATIASATQVVATPQYLSAKLSERALVQAHRQSSNAYVFSNTTHFASCVSKTLKDPFRPQNNPFRNTQHKLKNHSLPPPENYRKAVT
jgi:hypothetical protein